MATDATVTFSSGVFDAGATSLNARTGLNNEAALKLNEYMVHIF